MDSGRLASQQKAAMLLLCQVRKDMRSNFVLSRDSWLRVPFKKLARTCWHVESSYSTPHPWGDVSHRVEEGGKAVSGGHQSQDEHFKKSSRITLRPELDEEKNISQAGLRNAFAY